MKFCVVFLFVLVHCAWIDSGAGSPAGDCGTKSVRVQIEKLFKSAIDLGDTESVEKLVSYIRGMLTTPLIDAVEAGNEQIVEVLLKGGAEADAEDPDDPFGTTVLHKATAKKDNLHIIDLLIEHGADVNVKTRFNQTALEWAAQEGYEKMVERLIKKYGAVVNHQDSFRNTALHKAAADGRVEVVKVLLDNGADRKIENQDHETALDVAEKAYKETPNENLKQVVDLLKAD